MLLIMLILATFGNLPPLGTISIFDDPKTNLYQMIWPALSVGYRYSSVVARMLRSSILEVYCKIIFVQLGLRVCSKEL